MSRKKIFEEVNLSLRGRSNIYEETIKSIVLLARKHNLDLELLMDAFIEAWEKKIFNLGDLRISCRKEENDIAIFLLTKNDEVISQFPIKEEVLRNSDLLKSRAKNIVITFRSRFEKKDQVLKINELRLGMKKINLKAKILDMTPKKLITTRFGSQSYISNASIADTTGKIKLSLWNNNIDQVKKGDEIEINNCYVASFAGEPQLRIGRKGKITVIKKE